MLIRHYLPNVIGWAEIAKLNNFLLSAFIWLEVALGEWGYHIFRSAFDRRRLRV